MLGHLFGTICLQHTTTLIPPSLLKPPSRGTCSITISKPFFTAMPILLTNKCVCVCVCVYVCVHACVCACVVSFTVKHSVFPPCVGSLFMLLIHLLTVALWWWNFSFLVYLKCYFWLKLKRINILDIWPFCFHWFLKDCTTNKKKTDCFGCDRWH